MEAVKKVRGTCSVLFKDVLLLAGGLAVAAIAQPARAIPLELNYDNGAFIAIDNVVGDSDPRVDYMTSSYLSGNTQALPVLAYDNSPGNSQYGVLGVSSYTVVTNLSATTNGGMTIMENDIGWLLPSNPGFSHATAPASSPGRTLPRTSTPFKAGMTPTTDGTVRRLSTRLTRQS